MPTIIRAKRTGETSSTWAVDTVGANLGPADGVVGNANEYTIVEALTDTLIATRDGETRAAVRFTGQWTPLPEASGWIDMVDIGRALLCAVNRSGSVCYERSFDRGATWQSFTVSDTDAVAGAVWVDPQGRVGVVYVSSGVIVQRVSTNAYAAAPTWGAEMSIAGTNVTDIDDCIERGMWHFAWIEGTSLPYTVYHVMSNDGGATTVGSAVEVADDAAATGIGITVDTGGNLQIRYALAAGGDATYRSTDLGQTWSLVS